MSLVAVVNNTDSEQIALIDGEQYVFVAKQVRYFKPNVADEIIAANRMLEFDTTSFEDYDPVATVESRVYLANLTGNPDAPDKVLAEKYSFETRRTSQVMVDNPNKIPHPFKASLDLGQQEYETKAGKRRAYNRGLVEFVIPPYKTVPVETKYARWLLNRAANVEPEHQGKLAKSRPKPSYWPDESWAYEDIRAFLQLHSPNTDLGPETVKGMSESDVYEAKEKLIHKLFFVYADPKRQVFNRKEFEAFLRRQRPSVKETEKSLQEAVKAVKR